MSRLHALTIACLASCSLGLARDGVEMKFADCPPAVQKAFQAEAKGAKIETVTKDDEDGETMFWADLTIGGVAYSVGILEDGTLAEMNLDVDDKEIDLADCPALVRTTFQSEVIGVKLGKIGKDLKYGVTIYETKYEKNGKSYEIIVAEDGTLVEKVLVIDDEEVELSACPQAVQNTFRDQAKGGAIRDLTRSTGISHKTYEAEIEIKKKVYLVEVAESGKLISKSLEASED